MLLRLLTNRRNQVIIDRSGMRLTVKQLVAHTAIGLEEFRDVVPEFTLTDVNIRVIGKIFAYNIPLTVSLRMAIVEEINSFHAKEDISFDCYAFANLLEKKPRHPVKYLLDHWELHTKRWLIKRGEVIFLLTGKNNFLHAAIYLGRGLYISIYGAGGDLEISTLKQMKLDFKSQRVVIAKPIKT